MNKPVEITNETLYGGLPDFVKEEGHLKLKGSSGSLVGFLDERIGRRHNREGLEADLRYKTVFLDNTDAKRRKYKFKPTKSKTLTAKEKKKFQIFHLDGSNQRFEDFLPLHKLWKDYLRELVNFERVTPRNLPDVTEKLLKADLHGSIVTVTRATCPSLIGQTGIVLQETRNTFKIITRENRIKTLPKPNTVFSCEVEGYIFTIYGNNFRKKPSDRSSKKFKIINPNVDL